MAGWVFTGNHMCTPERMGASARVLVSVRAQTDRTELVYLAVSECGHVDLFFVCVRAGCGWCVCMRLRVHGHVDGSYNCLCVQVVEDDLISLLAMQERGQNQVCMHGKGGWAALGRACTPL